MIFINKADPDDKEWAAHIHLLNEYTPEDRQLRHIVQYARSGPHYPAHWHVDLIDQYAANERLDEQERTYRPALSGAIMFRESDDVRLTQEERLYKLRHQEEEIKNDERTY